MIDDWGRYSSKETGPNEKKEYNVKAGYAAIF